MQATRSLRDAGGAVGKLFAGSVKSIHGVTLQQRDLDRLAILAMQHACAFAEHVHRADARTTGAQNICVENAQGRAAQIAGGDALDEAGHIDVRRTGGRAGRVEAVEAAIRLNHSGLRRERRLQLAEAFAQLRIVG